MDFPIHPWTKTEREAYKDSTARYNRYDVGEYMEDLVDTWHAVNVDVSLYDFLGLLDDEIDDWVRFGIVPNRIHELWKEGNY